MKPLQQCCYLRFVSRSYFCRTIYTYLLYSCRQVEISIKQKKNQTFKVKWSVVVNSDLINNLKFCDLFFVKYFEGKFNNEERGQMCPKQVLYKLTNCEDNFFPPSLIIWRYDFLVKEFSSKSYYSNPCCRIVIYHLNVVSSLDFYLTHDQVIIL